MATLSSAFHDGLAALLVLGSFTNVSLHILYGRRTLIDLAAASEAVASAGRPQS